MTAARAQRIDDWVVHRPNIVRSVAARVPGIDAEEATSRALEKMVRIVSTGGQIDDPAPYWRRAAVNEAISMTREAGRARPVEDDTLDGLTPPVAGAELDAERQADVSMLRTALSDLAEDDRQILLERHVHDKAVTDIATGLGVRPHAVTMRLRRAEERLAGAFAAAHAQAVNEPECRTTRAAMHDYLKDRLLPRRRARVEAHMDGCAECTRAFIDVREVSWMLRDYGQHVIAGAIATGALGAVVGAGAAGAGAGAAGGGAAGAGAPRSFGKKEAAIVAGVLAALAVGGGAMALVANQPDDPPAAQSVPNPGAGGGDGGGGAGGDGAGGGGADGGDGGAGSEGTDGDGAGGDGAGGDGAGGDGAGGDGAGGDGAGGDGAGGDGAGGDGAGGAGAEGTGEGDSGGGSAGEGAGGSGESVDSEGANDGAGGGGRGDGGSDAGSEDAGARGDVGGEDASGGTDSEGTGREGTDGDDAGREGDGGTIVGGSDGDGEPEATDESDGDGQPEGQPDAEGENGGADGDGSTTDDTTSGVGAGIKDWLATLGIGDGTPSEGSGSDTPPGTSTAEDGDASNESGGGSQPDDGGASDESDGGSQLNDDDSDGTNSGVGAGIKDWLATLGIGDGTPSDAEGEDDTGTSSGTETGVGTDGTEPGTTDGASRGSDGPAAADGTDTGIGAEMTSWLGRLGAIGIPGFLLIVVILWLWERWSRPEDG